MQRKRIELRSMATALQVQSIPIRLSCRVGAKPQAVITGITSVVFVGSRVRKRMPTSL